MLEYQNIEPKRILGVITGPTIKFLKEDGTWSSLPTGAQGGGMTIGESDNRYLQLTGGNLTGNLGVGITAQARLHVKGTGNTSATTSVIVETLSGASLFKVNDAGVIIGENLNNPAMGGSLEVYASGTKGFRVRNSTSVGEEWFSVGQLGPGVVSFNAAGGSTRIGGADYYTARLNIATASATVKGIAIRRFVSQSANLQEWQDENGTILSRIDADGKFFGQVDGVSLIDHVHKGEDITTGTVADARLTTNVALKNSANVFTATNIFQGNSGSSVAFTTRVNSEAIPRFSLGVSGIQEWGDGINTRDVNLYRWLLNTTPLLRTDGALYVNAALYASALANKTNGGYAQFIPDNSGPQSLTSTASNIALKVINTHTAATGDLTQWINNNNIVANVDPTGKITGRLVALGTTTTSSEKALIVTDSVAKELFSVRNDGEIKMGNHTFFNNGNAQLNGSWNWINTTSIFSGSIIVRNTGTFGFVSGPYTHTSSVDIAISRNTAGVLEVNNGTAGQFGDIIAKNITASETIKEGGLSLSAKYLGITDVSVDSAKLGGQLPAYYLDSTNLTGSISDARLSSNVALRDTSNTFSSFLAVERTGTTSSVLLSKVTSDAEYRFLTRISGLMEWGDGTNARDTFLYRSSINELKTDGAFRASTSRFNSIYNINSGLNSFINLLDSGLQVGTSITSNVGLRITNSVTNATGDLTQWIKGTTTVARIDNSGKFFGLIDDTALSSNVALKNASNEFSLFQSIRIPTVSAAFQTFVGGEAFARWRIFADGKQEWGDGTNARDTNLYRTGVGILKTDGEFHSASRFRGTEFANLATWNNSYYRPTNTGSEIFTGIATNTALKVINSNTTPTANLQEFYVGSDGLPKLTIDKDGRISWGTGLATVDTVLYRYQAGGLRTDGRLVVGNQIHTTAISNVVNGNNSAIAFANTGTEVSTAVSTNVALKTINTVTNATGDLQQWIKGTTTVALVDANGKATFNRIDVNNTTVDKISLLWGTNLVKSRINLDANLSISTNATFDSALSQWVTDDSTKTKFSYLQHVGNNRHEFRVAGPGAGVAWAYPVFIDLNGIDAIGYKLNGVNLFTSGKLDDAVLSSNVALRDASNTFTLYNEFTRVLASDAALGVRAAGNATQNFVIHPDGKMGWGNGTDARDTNLYRNAVNELKTDSVFRASSVFASFFRGTLANSTTGSNARVEVNTTGTDIKTEVAANTALKVFNTNASPTANLQEFYVGTEVFPRLTVGTTGKLSWGTGLSGVDTHLERSSIPGWLHTPGNISVGGMITATSVGNLTHSNNSHYRLTNTGSEISTAIRANVVAKFINSDTAPTGDLSQWIANGVTVAKIDATGKLTALALHSTTNTITTGTADLILAYNNGGSTAFRSVRANAYATPNAVSHAFFQIGDTSDNAAFTAKNGTTLGRALFAANVSTFADSYLTAVYRNYRLDVQGSFNADTIREGEVLLIDKYATKSHTHSAADLGQHNHAGEDITSGTVADIRLSSNVPLKDAHNYFTATQTIQRVGGIGVQTMSIGDVHSRWAAGVDGKQEWGDGTNPRDTNLYRSGPGVLKTDGKFNAVLGLQENGLDLSDKYLGISATAVDSNKLNGQLADFYASNTSVDQKDTALLALLRDNVAIDGDTLKKLNDKIVAIQAIIGDGIEDADSIVDTVTELLNVFKTFPENTDIFGILNSKVAYSDIINDLLTIETTTGKTLDARQGKVLKDLLDALEASKLDKTATAVDSAKLGGQLPAYYLNSTNLTGTIDDARLSSNVALKNVANDFTANTNTFKKIEATSFAIGVPQGESLRQTLDVRGSLSFDYSSQGTGIYGYSNLNNRIMSITRYNTAPSNASLLMSSYGGFVIETGLKTPDTLGTRVKLTIPETGDMVTTISIDAPSLKESGTSLSAKYLGIGAVAVDSAKLGNQLPAYYLDSANLTGSIVDARLSSNVALKNANNIFTAAQFFTRATLSDPVILSKVTGDTGDRFSIKPDGKQEWGNGTDGRDTNLYRTAPNALKTDGEFHAGGYIRGTGTNSGLANAVTFNNSLIKAANTGTEIVTTVAANTVLKVINSNASPTANLQEFYVGSETFPRLTIDKNGIISWGSGTAAIDVSMFRYGNGAIAINKNFWAQQGIFAPYFSHPDGNNISVVYTKSTGTEISTAIATNVAAKVINTVTNATGDLQQWVKGTTTVAKIDSNGALEAGGDITFKNASGQKATLRVNTAFTTYILNDAGSLGILGVATLDATTFRSNQSLGIDFDNNGANPTSNFYIQQGANSATPQKYVQVFGTSGNVLLQTGGIFIDAGFKLDVNGTTRLNGAVTIGSTQVFNSSGILADGALSGNVALKNINNNFSISQTITSNSNSTLTINGANSGMASRVILSRNNIIEWNAGLYGNSDEYIIGNTSNKRIVTVTQEGEIRFEAQVATAVPLKIKTLSTTPTANLQEFYVGTDAFPRLAIGADGRIIFGNGIAAPIHVLRYLSNSVLRVDGNFQVGAAITATSLENKSNWSNAGYYPNDSGSDIRTGVSTNVALKVTNSVTNATANLMEWIKGTTTVASVDSNGKATFTGAQINGSLTIGGLQVFNSSGDLVDTALSSNVALKNVTNTFTGSNHFNGSVNFNSGFNSYSDQTYFREGALFLRTDLVPAITVKLAASSTGSLVILADGKVEWGDGTNTRDTNLYRSSAGLLKTDGNLHVAQAITTGLVMTSNITNGNSSNGRLAFETTGIEALSTAVDKTALKLRNTNTGTITANLQEFYVGSETFPRLAIDKDGKMSWGTGSAAVDTNLYRVSNNTVRTDGTFHANEIRTVGGTIAGGTYANSALRFLTTGSEVSTGVSSNVALKTTNTVTNATGDLQQWIKGSTVLAKVNSDGVIDAQDFTIKGVPLSFKVGQLEGGTIWHSARAFTTSGVTTTVSTVGTTVTASANAFHTANIGHRLIINGEVRTITGYTSATAVTVKTAYSQNFTNVAASDWYGQIKAIEVDSEGNVFTYGGVQHGGASPGYVLTKGNGTGSLETTFALKVNQYSHVGYNYEFHNIGILQWSSTNNFSGTKDLGISRTSAGVLEVNNGTAGTLADLRVKNLTATGTFTGSIGDTSLSSNIPLKNAINTFTAQNSYTNTIGGNWVITTKVSSDVHNRLVIDANGKQTWGDGAGLYDTNLYRSGVGALRTDGTFTVTGNTFTQSIGNISSHNNSKVSFTASGTEVSTAISANVALKTINTVTNATGDLQQWITGTTTVAKIKPSGIAEFTGLKITGTSDGFDGGISSEFIRGGKTYAQKMTLSRPVNASSGFVRIFKGTTGSSPNNSIIDVYVDGGWNNNQISANFRVILQPWAVGTEIIVEPYGRYNSAVVQSITTGYVTDTDLGIYLQIGSVNGTQPGNLTVYVSRPNNLITDLTLDPNLPTFINPTQTKSVVINHLKSTYHSTADINTQGSLILPNQLNGFLKTNSTGVVATSVINGEDITSGTVADIRLSNNVALKNAQNVFTQFQEVRLSSNAAAWVTRMTGDSVARWATDINGKQEWGDGASTRDTNLYRNVAGVLRTDGGFSIGGTLRVDDIRPGNNSTNAQIYLDQTGVQAKTTVSDNIALRIFNTVTNATGDLTQWIKGTTTVARIDNTGKFFGLIDDTALSSNVALKNASNTFTAFNTFAGFTLFDGGIQSRRTTATWEALGTSVPGDANRRFILQANGAMWWGDGTAVVDTTLYRSSAGVLKTDGNFIVNGTATIGSLGSAVMAPDVTTSTTAVAYTLGTKNTLTHQGAKFVSVKNGNDEVLSISRSNLFSAVQTDLNLPGAWSTITTGARFDINTTSQMFLSAPNIFLQGQVSVNRTGDSSSTATQKSSYTMPYQAALWNGTANTFMYAGLQNIASTTVNLGHRLAFKVNTTNVGLTDGIEALSLFSTGNVTVGTTTDSGFKFDVNGTTRFGGNTTITGNINISGTITASGYNNTSWDAAVTHANSSHLTLGETSTTAYRGDRGKTAYDYSQVGHLPLSGGNLLNGNSTNTENILLGIRGGYATTAQSHYAVMGYYGTTPATTVFGTLSNEEKKNWFSGIFSDNSYYNASSYSIVNKGLKQFTIDTNGQVIIPGTLRVTGIINTVGGLQENGVNLSNKYLGINATAKDSERLGGQLPGFYASTTYVDNADTAVIALLRDSVPTDGDTLNKLNNKILSINAIIGDGVEDADTIVNTVTELLNVFRNYPEGADLSTILNNKVNYSDIVNDLLTLDTTTGKTLDARQGRILKGLVDALEASKLDKTATAVNSDKLGNQLPAYYLNAANLTGTIPDSVIGVNFARRDTANTFKNGIQTIEDNELRLTYAADATRYGRFFMDVNNPTIEAVNPSGGTVQVKTNTSTWSFIGNAFGGADSSEIRLGGVSKHLAITNNDATKGIGLHTAASNWAKLFIHANGNTLIGTTGPNPTDTGYKLDVSGNTIIRNGLVTETSTATVVVNTIKNTAATPTADLTQWMNGAAVVAKIAPSGNFTTVNNIDLTSDGSEIRFVNSGTNGKIRSSGGTLTISNTAGNPGSETIRLNTAIDRVANISAGIIRFSYNNYAVTNAQLYGETGNLVLQKGGTFVDAGFRLDVQGTTRVNTTVATDVTLTVQNSNVSPTGDLTQWRANNVTVARVDATGKFFGTFDGVSLIGHVHKGEDITSGTVADVRLSGNVPLKNAASNLYTGYGDYALPGIGNWIISGRVTSEAFSRFVIDNTGKLNWGDGITTRDTFLYRSSAGILKTDGDFHSNGIRTVGVYNTVTGNNSSVYFRTTGTEITTAVASNVTLKVQNTQTTPTGNLTEWITGINKVVAKVTPDGFIDAAGFKINGSSVFVNNSQDINQGMLQEIEDIPPTELLKLDTATNWDEDGKYIGPPLVNCGKGTEFYTTDDKYLIRMRRENDPRRMLIG